MAKESGIGMTISVDDSAGVAKAITNDVVQLQFATPRAVADVTGLDKGATERLLLLADFTISMNGPFNDAADRAHAVFKTVPSTSVARTISLAHSGQALANETLLTDYSLNRGGDGSLNWSAPGSLADGAVPTWS
jgi:hypothetical protein